jgi:bacterial/archaeal transporter family-2 protein
VTTSTQAAARPLVLPAVLVSALSGAIVATQGRLNGDLSSAGAGAVVTTWLSYVGTLVTVALVILVQGRTAATARILRHDARWWWYAVGLCGVPIVVMFAVGIPVVGVAIASVCSVAGQTVAGLSLDARGVGVPAPLRLTGRRLVAAAAAVLGLVLAVGSGPTASMGTVVGLGALMFVAGAVLAGQQAGNGRVNLATGDAVLPALTSSAGGTLGVSVLLGVAAAAGRLHGVTLPGPGQWYLYLGGPLGAAITVCAAWSIRHLGTFALTLGVVVGQMATAVVVDLVTGVGGRWSTYLAVAMITAATVLVVLPARPARPSPARPPAIG